MFNRCLFTLISRLVGSRWARGYAEHHGACEVARVARLGPLHLEVNHCFVLDHDDARVSVQLPLPAWHNGPPFDPLRTAPSTSSGHRLRQAQGSAFDRLRTPRFSPIPLILSYTACLGADRIRRPGFAAVWLRPDPPAPPIDFDEPFPF